MCKTTEGPAKVRQRNADMRIEDSGNRGVEDRFRFVSSKHLGELERVVAHLFFVPLLEVPDLAHEINVELWCGWGQEEAGYRQVLRYVRISSTNPEKVIVSRPDEPRLTSAADVAMTETIPSGDVM